MTDRRPFHRFASWLVALGCALFLNLSVAQGGNLPDVHVVAIDFAPPVAGQPLTLLVTIRNAAPIDTPAGVPVGVGVQIDGNHLGSFFVRATGNGVTRPLAGGETYQGSVLLPAAVVGPHRIRAIVDDVGRFAESNESNNQLERSLVVPAPTQPPGYDLEVQLIELEPEGPLQAGATVHLFATVCNRGPQAIPPGVNIGVGIQVDDDFVGAYFVPAGQPLGAAGSADACFRGEIDSVWRAVGGRRAIAAFADDVDRLPEADETNNRLRQHFDIPGAFVPLPAPVVIGPGAQTPSLRPTFRWNAVEGARHYRLRVRRAVNGDIFYQAQVPSGTSHAPPTDASLPANVDLRWSVRAERPGKDGPWSPERSLTIHRPDLLGVGLHSHIGYPADAASELDDVIQEAAITAGPCRTFCYQLEPCQASPMTPGCPGEARTEGWLTEGGVSCDDPPPCINWGAMDTPALTEWANDFRPSQLVHSGLAWDLLYQPFSESEGTPEGSWRSALEPASRRSLEDLTVRDIVAHPILLPAVQERNLGTDQFGRANRKTLALIGTGPMESDLIRPFTIEAQGYYRVRAPAMFNIVTAEGGPPTDADLFPVIRCPAESGGVMPPVTYAPLIVTPPAPGSFEAFVRSQYKQYIRDIALAARDSAGNKVKSWLIGNEPAAVVFMHPQIYAHHLIALADMLDEIESEEGIVLNKDLVLANLVSPAGAKARNCGESWTRTAIEELRLAGRPCLFRYSSLDHYLEGSGYGDLLAHFPNFQAMVGALCPGTRFFIKEASFGGYYGESLEFDEEENRRTCDPAKNVCLQSANQPADGVPLDARQQEEIRTFVALLRQLGFEHVNWFNHFRTGAEHGDLVTDTVPGPSGAIESTRLGEYLRSLNP